MNDKGFILVPCNLIMTLNSYMIETVVSFTLVSYSCRSLKRGMYNSEVVAKLRSKDALRLPKGFNQKFPWMKSRTWTRFGWDKMTDTFRKHFQIDFPEIWFPSNSTGICFQRCITGNDGSALNRRQGICNKDGLVYWLMTVSQWLSYRCRSYAGNIEQFKKYEI